MNSDFFKTKEDKLAGMVKAMADLDPSDYEVCHATADAILMDALRLHGSDDLVDAYKKKSEQSGFQSA